MANEAQVTFSGTATANPDLRFTGSGAAVAGFTVAVNPRVKSADGQWQDGEAAFYRVSAWKKLGEHVSESVRKGDRVTVVGRLAPRSYEHNGEKRTSLDVNADDVALSLLFKPALSGGGAQRQQQAPADDPWAAPAGDETPAPF